jgi:tight adherence protein C
MLSYFEQLAHSVAAKPLPYSIGFLGLTVMVLLMLIARGMESDEPIARRMRAAARLHRKAEASAALLKVSETTPAGLFKALIPENPLERTQVRLNLAQAGFDGVNAVRNFYLLRLALALIGPLLVVVLYALRETTVLPLGLRMAMAGMAPLRILQILAVSVAVGFYGPGYWLNSKIKARKQRIEDGFPNALDLLQISAAAGMGFDAAMQRVGTELAMVSPDIAEEMLLVQREVLAGRPRELALTDMANRMGIAEALSFANVVLQSIQFGTSVSAALTAYAQEMRENRQLKAQEKANKLPVQMSAVMAMLMLPALLLITLGPIVIRYMRMHG